MTDDLRTSAEWNSKHRYVIWDPDGWDRENYIYSFHEELITEKEFLRRVSYSTILYQQ